MGHAMRRCQRRMKEADRHDVEVRDVPLAAAFRRSDRKLGQHKVAAELEIRFHTACSGLRWAISSFPSSVAEHRQGLALKPVPYAVHRLVYMGWFGVFGLFARPTNVDIERPKAIRQCIPRH